MKRRDLVGLYLLSVLVWSVLSVSGAVAAQEKGNLLLNGGFETPVSGMEALRKQHTGGSESGEVFGRICRSIGEGWP